MAKSKATPWEILAQILIGIMGCRQVGPRICRFDLIPWDLGQNCPDLPGGLAPSA